MLEIYVNQCCIASLDLKPRMHVDSEACKMLLPLALATKMHFLHWHKKHIGLCCKKNNNSIESYKCGFPNAP